MSDLTDALALIDQLLAEAEEIWWCEEHRATQLTIDHETKELSCWKKNQRFLGEWSRPYGPCRMVRKLLIDVETRRDADPSGAPPVS